MRKKIKDKKAEQQETKSRAKYKCSPELREIIQTVNAVPPGINLPPHREVIDKIEEGYLLKYNVSRKSDLDENTYVSMWFDIVDECFKNFSDKNYKKDVFDYWYERINEEHTKLKRSEYALLFSVLDTYEYVRKTRRDVNKIIKYVSELNAKSPILYLYDTDLYTPLVFSQIDGETKAHIQGFSKVIEKIDLERLRSCKICHQVFWAENKNSYTCSEPCRNALRQRRHRQKNKETVNAKRRAAYKSKKELKLGRERKNKSTTL